MGKRGPKKKEGGTLEYKLIGMKKEHWQEIKEDADKRGWTVSRYIRNVTVNFARGKIVNKE